MRLRHGAASHVGLVRQQNEDSFVAGGGVFAVCDGMGGARAGEVASEIACRFLMEIAPQADPTRLESTVADANRAIFLKSVEDSSLAGMGTTLTALVSTGDGVLVAHVGDSRAYLWREGGMRQLTDDHSLVAELVRRGQLTPAQAAVHPHRSVITRALGTDGVVKPDIFPISLEPGDRLLICSDGLSGMVAEPDMARLLGTGEDPQSIAQSLVEAALEGGGEDNVTVVVLVVDEDAQGDARSPRGRRGSDGTWRRQTGVRAGAPAGVHGGQGPERAGVWIASAGGSAAGGAGCSSWRWRWCWWCSSRWGGWRSSIPPCTTWAPPRRVPWPSSTACPAPSSGGACTASWRWEALRTLRWSSTSRTASTPTNSRARRRGSSSSAASPRSLEHTQQGTPSALPRHPADHHRVRHGLHPELRGPRLGLALLRRHLPRAVRVGACGPASAGAPGGPVSAAHHRPALHPGDPDDLSAEAGPGAAAVRVAHRGAGHVRGGAGGGAALQAPGPVQVHRRACRPRPPAVHHRVRPGDRGRAAVGALRRGGLPAARVRQAAAGDLLRRLPLRHARVARGQHAPGPRAWRCHPSGTWRRCSPYGACRWP